MLHRYVELVDMAVVVEDGCYGETDRLVVVQGDQPERLIAWLESNGFASVARGN